MERKIIQISTVPSIRSVGFELFALADDGTLWFKTSNVYRGWDQVTPIPQDKLESQNRDNEEAQDKELYDLFESLQRLLFDRSEDSKPNGSD